MLGVNLAIYKIGTEVLIRRDIGARKWDKYFGALGSQSVSDEMERSIDCATESAILTRMRRKIVIL